MTSAATHPPVSVIVPAFDAEATIGACVDALMAQSYPASAMDIVVVDNGSRDGTRAIAERHGGRIRTLVEPKRGPSAARNAGLRASSCPLVAFTDADCVPERDWLRVLVATSRAAPELDIVGGPILALPGANLVARFAERLFDQERAVRHDRPPYVITANMLARRAVLERVGGFDERLARGEDVDLGYRARFDLGARLGFVPGAIVRHRNCATLPDLFAKGVEHGRSSAGILAKHGARLGTSPWRRALARARWGRIAREFARHGRRRGERAAGLRAWTDEDVAFPLCGAIFETGKQLGLLRAAITGRS